MAFHGWTAGLLASLAIAFGSGPALGQTASCFLAPAKMSEAEIGAFLANPAALLSRNPLGGLAMSSDVRALGGSSALAIEAIVSLVATANPQQRSAIGAGLARAAAACARTNPEYAAAIQEKVAAIEAPDVIAGFLSASNEVQTAALGATSTVGGGAVGGTGGGGGAAGIGGGGGGGGAGGGNSGGAGGDTSVAQGSASYSVGSGGSFSKGDDGSDIISNSGAGN